MSLRVLVIVSGGMVEQVLGDDGIDVEVFDRDDYLVDPEDTTIPPPHFKDLCKEAGVPYVETVQ